MLSLSFDSFFHRVTGAGLLCKFEDELLGLPSTCLSAQRRVPPVLLPEKSRLGRKDRLGRKFDSSKVSLSFHLIHLTKPASKA